MYTNKYIFEVKITANDVKHVLKVAVIIMDKITV